MDDPVKTGNDLSMTGRELIGSDGKNILRHSSITGCLILLYMIFILCSPLFAQNEGEHENMNSNEHKHVHMDMDMNTSTTQTAGSATAQGTQNNNLFASVTLEEKLGAKIPMDLTFTDENGKEVKLSDIIDRPVLLQLVFYHCPQSCNLMMANLASILKSVTFKPGAGYRILTVSFDHEDTTEVAAETKSNYVNMLEPGFPVAEWKFLTGKLPAINALTSAVGFRFKRIEEHNFVHPNVLIVLAQDGTVIRYLYGTEYLPFDVSMAITEADKGTPAISIKKLLTFCFDYDSKGKKYVFKSFRAAGAILLLSLAGFFFFVLRKGNRNRQKLPQNQDQNKDT